MSQRNKRKSTLKSSILLLLLAAILLISSTYAWFTSNQTVTVSSLNVNVVAKNGLQISVDGSNWKSILSNEDIKNAVATYSTAVNQIPSVLEPVSTAGTIDTETGFMNMYYGEVSSESGEAMLTATKSTEANGEEGKFIAFDLFFKVDADTPIYLTPSSNVLYNSSIEGETDKGLQNAARVAFVYEGHTAIGSNKATIQGLKSATDATTYIWEPNYDVHTPAGVANANDTYGITTTETGAERLDYSGIKDEISTGISLGEANAEDNATYFSTVSPKYSTVKGFTNNVPLSTLTLSSGITKIRVYMWIEGQDVDCENNASGSNIVYNLQLTSNNA